MFYSNNIPLVKLLNQYCNRDPNVSVVMKCRNAITFLKPHFICLSIKTRLRLHGLINRGSYISARVLLNLFNELRNIDKMRGLSNIFFTFSQRVS